MTLSRIDLAVVIVYFIAIFGLAQFVSRDKTGKGKDSTDYFLASRNLPWWAIGSSLIAANISAEQIVGMSGSGYAIGLAIASYEWMAALTLLIVGKFFLPIFLRNEIYTMPQLLEQRYGPHIRTLMAVFWLGLYVFVNLTSIVWLGSIAVAQVAGVDQDVALWCLGSFALLYQIRGGLKAVALTDIVQVTLLVLGGLTVSAIALGRIGGGSIPTGFAALMHRAPDHFHMILSPSDPNYKNLPGISVLVGGMWIANLGYWGFNQYIVQRALAAKDIAEAQKGIVFAAYLKLIMPLIIVVPGIAALVLAPSLPKPDDAYPTMMRLLPTGLLGLVFAALMAAIIASAASKINSVATIFTLDLYRQIRPARFRGIAAGANEVADPVSPEERQREERHLVLVGRITAVVAVLLAMCAARPLLGHSDQAFQFIQEYTGYFTPGIVIIFMLGLFWKRASEAGALAGALGSFLLSIVLTKTVPSLPFMNRWVVVFVAGLLLAMVVSLLRPQRRANLIITNDVNFKTTSTFNALSVGIVAVLVALYAWFW